MSLFAALALLLLSAAVLCAHGEGGRDVWPYRLAFVVEATLTAGGLAGTYLLAALGFGRLLRRSLRGAAHPWLLQFALGCALLLSLSHVLAALGPLTNAWVARGILAVGVILLLDQLRASDLRLHTLSAAASPWLLLAVPASALLLTSASSLPGWLWASEAHGYDVLEYHLQLPAEWLREGRLAGLEHNVYSFLPNFMEAAYLHLASTAGSTHAGDGLAVRAAQFLHAEMALIAVVLLARLSGVWLRGLRQGATNEPHASGTWPSVGPLAAALLAVPWVIIVGSMAYNEMALVLLFAAATLAIAERNLSSRARCVLPALLLGAACGCKLTALFLAALPLALAALFFLPLRSLLRNLPPALAVFILPLLPYFARNLHDTGNPIFPFAPSLLGTGHWTSEQAQRWQQGHHFEGSLAEWFAAVWERGIGHSQWSFFFALVLLAALMSLWKRRTRFAALLALGMLIMQLVAWSLLTHVQARFLLPSLVPAALLTGLALVALPQTTCRATQRLYAAAACLPALLLTLHAATIYAQQRGGEPAEMLNPAAYDFVTGEAYRQDPALLRERGPSPQYYVNIALSADSLVYLVGGATPLYYSRPVLYHTTWDASPLGLLRREHGEDFAVIARGLRKRGVTHLLIDLGELSRLQRDG